MSRIGKQPIAIPAGVKANFANGVITVEGPKGKLSQAVHSNMIVEVGAAEITVSRPNDEKLNRSLHGLTRTLIANMVEGVTNGYTKELEISEGGYRAQMNGNTLVMNLGFSHDVKYDAPAGIKIEAPTPNKLVVSGADKQLVGQVAAEIRGKRPPEPYHGKGIKYSDEVIRHKAGKAGK
ncbi:MAG: 50S ribosomal protein L6 [Clostridia bacterium]|nr:50S ribosomal protein L6 [Clostridia bacterium]